MPAQLSLEYHQTAREAFEKKKGGAFADHKIPSGNDFEKKVGDVETVLKDEKLSSVSHVAQEESRHLQEARIRPSALIERDTLLARAPSKTFFYVPMPSGESSLRNRFEIMGAGLGMPKMKYVCNGILATASLEVMKEYSEYLCGERVWGFVIKRPNNTPMACPHTGHVL